MKQLSKEQLSTDIDSGIFGSAKKFSNNVKCVILPLCWDATASYHRGAAQAPEAIMKASHQLEGFNHFWGDFDIEGIYFDQEFVEPIHKFNKKTIELVDKYRVEPSSLLLKEINSLCKEYNAKVEGRIKYWEQKKTKVVAVGGDHGSSFPYINSSIRSQKDSTTIIHIDAHFDLRDSYEGFDFSHASVMRNIHKQNFKNINFVHLGIRDFCKEELNVSKNSNIETLTLLDDSIQDDLLGGESWSSICDKVDQFAEKKIYISLDIDGLSQAFCPGTGTPVPGGLTFEQLTFLFRTLSKNHELVGFDLVEVSPRENDLEWNANVAARVLQNLLYWLKY